MKLDSKAMRHLTSEDWRVLTAVEIGSKNHEVVPTPLIESVAKLRGGASRTRRAISSLAKAGLIARPQGARYDGYRLTYGGLDYLALHAHASQGGVYSVGDRIGVGKESDITAVADASGAQKVLKIHRLGRVSFRTVKANRDYLQHHRHGGSWMYLSRLAAEREFAFMRVLREEGFLVPEPIAQNRHTVLMEFVDAFPLRQIASVPDPAALYAELIAVILRLARHGLIHGDFNEFNILIKEEEEEVEAGEQQPSSTQPSSTNGKAKEPSHNDGDDDDEDDDNSKPTTKVTPVIIDFPQMVSMDHANAEMYFDRDVACVRRFFERRFHFVSAQPGPFFRDARRTVGKDGARRLDAAVEASGFSKRALKDLEAAIHEQQQQGSKGEEASDDDDDDDDDDEDEETEGEEEGGEEESENDDEDEQGGEKEEREEAEQTRVQSSTNVDYGEDPTSRIDVSKLSLKNET
ncbi:Rio2, N-terminal-domain-containing protein [Biscogniauxia marginata]|nr:Rio2, N-terminal-domain-containing protein [Biscogniauxia marginata]